MRCKCFLALHVLVEILSELCGLLAHQFRIDRSEEGVCRFCKNKIDSPLYLLCECFLGSERPLVLQLRRMEFQRILIFFKKFDLGNI